MLFPGVRRKDFEVLFAGNCDDYFASFDCNHCGAGAEDGGDGRFDGRGFRSRRSASREGCCVGEDDGRRRGGVCPGMSSARRVYEYLLRKRQRGLSAGLFFFALETQFPWK